MATTEYHPPNDIGLPLEATNENTFFRRTKLAAALHSKRAHGDPTPLLLHPTFPQRYFLLLLHLSEYQLSLSTLSKPIHLPLNSPQYGRVTPQDFSIAPYCRCSCTCIYFFSNLQPAKVCSLISLPYLIRYSSCGRARSLQRQSVPDVPNTFFHVKKIIGSSKKPFSKYSLLHFSESTCCAWFLRTF